MRKKFPNFRGALSPNFERSVDTSEEDNYEYFWRTHSKNSDQGYLNSNIIAIGASNFASVVGFHELCEEIKIEKSTAQTKVAQKRKSDSSTTTSTTSITSCSLL